MVSWCHYLVVIIPNLSDTQKQPVYNPDHIAQIQQVCSHSRHTMANHSRKPMQFRFCTWHSFAMGWQDSGPDGIGTGIEQWMRSGFSRRVQPSQVDPVDRLANQLQGKKTQIKTWICICCCNTCSKWSKLHMVVSKADTQLAKCPKED